MSGDLEDFLRRAAQRRQAKAAQQQQPAQQQRPRSRPQYSDSRTERIVQAVDDDIPVAEVVEDDTSSLAARRRRLEQSKKAAEQAEAAKRVRSAKPSARPATAATIPLAGSAAQDLLRILRQPGGIKQAILLREILDRPEHRW